MTRPVTLFTGQWADLPLEELCPKAAEWGYDGLELACWGDHFDVTRGAEDTGYCEERRELLKAHGLGVWAISNHLVGQAVADVVDDRHRDILPPPVRGDGDPDGVRSRAAAEMTRTSLPPGRPAALRGLDAAKASGGRDPTRRKYITGRSS